MTRESTKGAMRSVQIGVTRCDDKCENTVLLETQGPCGSARRCSDDTVTHDTSVQGKCHKSHPTRSFFCNDEVACQSRRSRFHWPYVYAGVGAEKLGGGSCVKHYCVLVNSFLLLSGGARAQRKDCLRLSRHGHKKFGTQTC